MYTTFHDTDERLPRAALFALLSILALFARCSDCRAQTHFEFNTSTIIMVDTTGEMTVGNTSWPVRAWCDSLTAGPMAWYGIKWQEMDGGHLWCITPIFRAHYAPGPGGKGLLIMPAGAIKTIEFLERQTYPKQ